MLLRRRALLRWLAAVLTAGVASACEFRLPSAANAPSQGAQPGSGTVVCALPHPPDSLDPARIVTAAGQALAAPVFDTLFSRGNAFELRPALAERWSVTPDGQRYTLRLRSGIRFHDDSPLTAQAVQVSLERLIGSERLTGRGAVSGLIRVVRALDAATVEITLRESCSTFLSQLVRIGTAPTSPQSLAGTGPFRYLGEQSGAHLLERWDACWRGAPQLDRVAFIAVPDPAERLRRLVEGSVDLVAPLGFDQLTQLTTADHVAVEAAPSTLALGIALHTQAGPFKDQRVRQALNYGVDRSALVHGVYQGYATPLSGPLGAVVEGAPPLPAFPYDPGRARGLLAAAGFGRGLEVQLLACKGRFPADTALAQALAQQLQTIGVRCEVTLLSSAEYITALTKSPEEAAARLLLVGYQPGDGTALETLYRLFHSEQWAPRGYNTCFFRDPSCDDLLDRARRATSVVERDRLVWQALELIQQQAPWIFLLSPHVLAARAVRLQMPALSPFGWASFNEHTAVAARGNDQPEG